MHILLADDIPWLYNWVRIPFVISNGKVCPGGMGGGGGVTQFGTLVRIHVQKTTTKIGDFCHRLVGSRDLQKVEYFRQKG